MGQHGSVPVEDVVGWRTVWWLVAAAAVGLLLAAAVVASSTTASVCCCSKCGPAIAVLGGTPAGGMAPVPPLLLLPLLLPAVCCCHAARCAGYPYCTCSCVLGHGCGHWYQPVREGAGAEGASFDAAPAAAPMPAQERGQGHD
jgi:hypothetical protein